MEFMNSPEHILIFETVDEYIGECRVCESRDLRDARTNEQKRVVRVVLTV